MRALTFIAVMLICFSCSMNSNKTTVTKLDGMTSTGNTFIKEFYLLDPIPNSVKELESIMRKTAINKPHQGFESEVFVFIKENGDEGTPFLSSYEKDQSQGVAPEDILGSIEYNTVNGKRFFIELEIND